jgi:hypothetical protein
MGLIAIPLPCGASAYIDDADKHLTRFRWTLNSAGHPVRSVGRKKRYLSQDVMNFPGVRVGHINFDPCDATRLNLCGMFRPRRTHRSVQPVRKRTYTDTYFVTVQGRYVGDFPTFTEAEKAYAVEVAKRGLRYRLVW